MKKITIEYSSTLELLDKLEEIKQKELADRKAEIILRTEKLKAELAEIFPGCELKESLHWGYVKVRDQGDDVFIMDHDQNISEELENQIIKKTSLITSYRDQNKLLRKALKLYEQNRE